MNYVTKHRLIINQPFDEKDVLEESFRILLGQRSKWGGVKYKTIDIEGEEMSIDRLLERYFFNSEYHTTPLAQSLKLNAITRL